MMGMGQCCCGGGGLYHNYVRLDPTTGAVIWKTYVAGDGTYDPTKNQVWEIEPLHGTSDMLVVVSDLVPITAGTGTPICKYSICRVDSTGAQLWYVNTTPEYSYNNPAGTLTSNSWFFPTQNPGEGRIVGSDGSRIIYFDHVPSIHNGRYSALNYSGVNLWSTSAGIVAVGTTMSIGVTNNRFLVLAPSSPNSDRAFDNSTGALFTFSFANGGLYGNQPIAVNQSANQYWSCKNGLSGDASNGVSNIYQISATPTVTGVSWPVLYTGGPLADRARWGPVVIPYVEKFHSGGTQGAIGVVDQTLTSIWSATSVSGEIWLSPNDCDSDSSSNSYFANRQSTVGGKYDVFMFDSSGSLQWEKTVFRNTPLDVTAVTGAANALALADTGELYVGGNP